MSRKARSKVRKAFACNKPGAEEFAKLVEQYSEEIEMCAALEEYTKYRTPEERRTAICTLLT